MLVAAVAERQHAEPGIRQLRRMPAIQKFAEPPRRIRRLALPLRAYHNAEQPLALQRGGFVMRHIMHLRRAAARTHPLRQRERGGFGVTALRAVEYCDGGGRERGGIRRDRRRGFRNRSRSLGATPGEISA